MSDISRFPRSRNINYLTCLDMRTAMPWLSPSNRAFLSWIIVAWKLPCDSPSRKRSAMDSLNTLCGCLRTNFSQMKSHGGQTKSVLKPLNQSGLPSIEISCRAPFRNRQSFGKSVQSYPGSKPSQALWHGGCITLPFGNLNKMSPYEGNLGFGRYDRDR